MFLPCFHLTNIYGAASMSKVPVGELKRCLGHYYYFQQACNLVNMYETIASVFL